MSYLNYNTKLIDYNLTENEIDLNFNEYLFDSNENKKVLEEVIYSISYSVMDNYNVDKVNFFVNSEKVFFIIYYCYPEHINHTPHVNSSLFAIIFLLI